LFGCGVSSSSSMLFKVAMRYATQYL
jgi:hypothetical protein